MGKIDWNNKEEVKNYYREKHKEWRLKNIDKIKADRKEKAEQYMEYRKRYNEANPEKVKIYQKNYRQNNIDKIRDAQKKYRINNPDKKSRFINSEEYRKYQKDYQREYIKNGLPRKKHLLRKNAYNLIRKNIIESRGCCEECGSQDNLELHHKNYDNNKNSLLLLCRKCHKDIHIELNNQGGTK